MPEQALQMEAPEAATLLGIEYRFGDCSYDLSSMHQKAQARRRFLRWAAEKQKDPESFEIFCTVRFPTTQEDLVDTEDKKVQKLISYIRLADDVPKNERLANRLSNLFDAAKEEDPELPGISFDSIYCFYYFLQKHPYLKYPIITLTPDNDIYASWKGGLNQVFSLHFESNENVHFVIFKPNTNNPDRKIITYGTDAVDTLMEIIELNSIWDWISDER